MSDLLKVAIPLLVLLGAGVGWLLRHYAFGGAVTQRASVSHTAAQMLSLMKQHGIDAKDLQSMEVYLQGKSDRALDIDALASTSGEGDLFPDLPRRYQISAFFGAKADAALAVAEAMLKETELTLSILLSDSENEALNNSQQAFRTYRDVQSEFASSIVRGGSLETTLYLMESIRLTSLRNDELKEELERRKRLQGNG